MSTGNPNPFPSHGAHTNAQPEYEQAQQAVNVAASLTQQHTPQHTPTPNNATANGRKRRASGTPGSRGVANLTPEQLAKKRANDREAQRAIRERTRNTIETLERRIRELESQQPFQDLQRVVQERDRALAECEELRRRLGAVAGIVGGQHPSLNELAALTAQQSPLPPLAQTQQQPQSQSQSQPQQQQALHPDLRPTHAGASSQSNHSNQLATSSYQSSDGSLRRWSPSLEQPPNQHFGSSNGSPYEQQQQHRPSPVQAHQTHTNGDRLGLNFLLDTTRQHASSSPTDPSLLSPSLPFYSRPPMIGPASCPLDSLLIDFQKSRRKMVNEGVMVEEAVGPDYPAFSSMIKSGNGDRPRCHPLSALLIDILSKFPDISKLPEKVAVLYIMFLILRWVICPCQKCYEKLPIWCRPVAEQLEKPHVAWADYLPWPHMRRQLALNEKEVRFDDFFVPYTTTLSLNWPLPHDCILLPTRDWTAKTNDFDPDDLQMNPAFEHHVRNLENWSLGKEFSGTFPHLVDGTVRIHDS